jgi:hypothetical protein
MESKVTLLVLIYYSHDVSLLFMYGLHWAMAPRMRSSEITAAGHPSEAWIQEPTQASSLPVPHCPRGTNRDAGPRRLPTDTSAAVWFLHPTPRALEQATHQHVPPPSSLTAAWIWWQLCRKSCSLLADRGYGGVINNQESVPKAVIYVCQEKGFPYFPFISFTIFGTNWSGQKVLLTITVRGFLSMHMLYLAYRNWPDVARTDHTSRIVHVACAPNSELWTPSITRPCSNLTTL